MIKTKAKVNNITAIEKIKASRTKNNAKILTTEKDYIKIKSAKNNDIRFLKIDLDIRNQDRLIDYLKLHI